MTGTNTYEGEPMMPNDTLDEIEARWPLHNVEPAPSAALDIRTLIEMVRARDALCEQRVAAAVQEERLRVEQERRRWLGDPSKSLHIPPADWGPPQNSADRPTTTKWLVDPPQGSGWRQRVFDNKGEADSYAEFCPAHTRIVERPAPEGAAPTKDGDTTRCSTPSQEDTKPGCGTAEAAPWCKDAMFVLTTHGDGAATTLHRGWKAICDAVVAVHYFEPDSDQRDEIMARFTDWEIWQNQGGVPWLWHSDYEDGAVTVQRVTEPPTDAGGPGSTSNTKSSLTQTVTAPRPTAGDVEQAHVKLDDLLPGFSLRERSAEELEQALIEKCLEIQRLREEWDVALDRARESARAELLAQIREQFRGTIRAVFDAEITAVANAVNKA